MVLPVGAGAVVPKQAVAGDTVTPVRTDLQPAPTLGGERPRRPSKAEPKAQGPEPTEPNRVQTPGGLRAPDATLSPRVLEGLRTRFGASFERLPPDQLASFARAYNEFTRPGTDRRDADKFLQAFGGALVSDRQRMVGEMLANPTESLTRLAPAIERQAGVMRLIEAADYVHRQADPAIFHMRDVISRSPATRHQEDTVTREQLNTTAGWKRFLQIYTRAVGGAHEVERAVGEADARISARYLEGRFIRSMEQLTQAGRYGKAPLDLMTPQDITRLATANLVELGRRFPQLQAFSPSQIQEMARGLAVPGLEHRFTIEPAIDDVPAHLDHELMFRDGTNAPVRLAAPDTEAPAPQAYEDQVRRLMPQVNIVRIERDDRGVVNRPVEQVSAVAVFSEGAKATRAGLAQAGQKLERNTLSASDLLPLAYQAQDHLMRQAGAQPGEAAGLISGAIDLGARIATAEEQARRDRNVRVGVAAVGVVSGVGLLFSGPLGWGVGVTGALAAGTAGSAVTTMALEVKDYRDRLRAGGLNHAGLMLTNLEQENETALAANLILNGAAAASGLPAVVAARRLIYAGGLVKAMRTEGEARTAAVLGFLEKHDVWKPAEWAALSAERQATAFRLLERFGSEVPPKAMRAMLEFGARDADVNNLAGAVSNVDHMYAAYAEMNRAEQLVRGRVLSERERTLNAVATIGTDAQGKFGYDTLKIIPVELQSGRQVSEAPQLLSELRQRAVRDAFLGIEQGEGVNVTALRSWRERYLAAAREMDPAKRGQAMADINRDLPADAQSAAWIRRHLQDTDIGVRLQPFTEGAYVHNFVDPARVYNMGRLAGLSEADASEAAYRATMHGFGNAFVAAPYPGLPMFGTVMRPGTTPPVRMFSDSQLANLRNVGRASLEYNQELTITPAQAAAWGIPHDPPPRGVRQLYLAAMRARNGELHPDFERWLQAQGETFREARRTAGLGAGATDADNLGNFVPDGMRKWMGIFSRGQFTPADQGTLGHQLGRFISGLNGYSIEEYAVGNITRFGENFSGPAARLGLYRPQGSSIYRSILQREGDQWVVARNTPPGAVSDAAEAITKRFAALRAVREREGDAAVVRAFYNQEQTGEQTLSLALLAEGNLSPAFDAAGAMRTLPYFSRQFQWWTQGLLYQAGVGNGVRTYDNR